MLISAVSEALMQYLLSASEWLGACARFPGHVGDGRAAHGGTDDLT